MTNAEKAKRLLDKINNQKKKIKDEPINIKKFIDLLENNFFYLKR